MSPRPRVSASPRLLIPGLFLAAVTGAWAWFHVAPPPPGERLELRAARHIDGWTFRPVPLSQTVMDILATTNLLNGVFTADDGTAVTVFAAEWRADSGEAMTVVQHTPDICWVGAGWMPIDLGQPRRVEIPLGEQVIPFEMRTFANPVPGHRQLVLWCTLVSGQILEEQDRWRMEADPSALRSTRFDWATRRTGVNQFYRNVLARRAATGRKQFVRFSVEVAQDWQGAWNCLRSFAPKWLRLGSRATLIR